MKTIEEEVKFQLSKNGWYLGETEIEVFDNINGVQVVTSAIGSDSLAYYENGKIYISKAIIKYASLPQIRIIALHEYAHKFPVPDCINTNHDIEYACDRWALKQMIKSGQYNSMELEDAILVFKDIINDESSATHPSSKSRYKRLKSILKEYMS